MAKKKNRIKQHQEIAAKLKPTRSRSDGEDLRAPKPSHPNTTDIDPQSTQRPDSIRSNKTIDIISSPAKPTQPAKPAKPAKPTQSAKPTQPAKPTKPTPAAQPARRPLLPLPSWLRFLLSILLLFAAAAFLSYFFLGATNMVDSATIDDFISDKPDLFYYSTLIIFFLTATLAALTWRPVLSVGIMFSLLTIVAYVNTQKFALRGAPFLPEELRLADQVGSLLDFVSIDSLIQLIVTILVAIIVAALLQFLLRKLFGRPQRTLLPRLAATAVSATGLILLCSPIIRHNIPNSLSNLEYVGWNQTLNYNDNGFVIGFLYNLGNLEAEPPADYSESAITEIKERYTAQAIADSAQSQSANAAQSATSTTAQSATSTAQSATSTTAQSSDPQQLTARQPLSAIADNIIIILAETSYDPILYTEYLAHDGGDVTPNLHQIFQKYPSGYMYSTEYGGGTANVEFEVQTGLSNFWTASSFPYLSSIPKYTETFPSLASFAKSQGFQTVGLHSYDGSVYKRNLVYPILGYDTFIDQTGMTHQEREGESEYINEASIYQEILDLLADTDEPQFISVATMQNHAPSYSANYPDRHFSLTTNEFANLTDDARYALEASYESLHYADQYLGDFIQALDNLDERTIVLWFGDHTIGQLDPYRSADDLAHRALAQLTPYFIYANFEFVGSDNATSAASATSASVASGKTTNTSATLREFASPYTTADIAAALEELGIGEINLGTPAAPRLTSLTKYIKGINLPTTSPNCLANTMLDLFNAEKPALFYLVADVCATTPVLAGSYWGDDTPPATQALHDYELVTYDLLAGKHYWLK